MMAFDRTSSSGRLEPETADRLRDVLGRAVRQGNHSEDLQDALDRAADEARTKGLQAEQLLIILKEIWYGLPDLSKATSRDVEVALLQELVTRCIQQYYAD